MELAALFSGGKDSNLALYLASQEHKIKYVVSAHAKRDDSYMFHIPNTNWTKLQAEAMGIRYKQFESTGVKEKEVEELKEFLKTLDIDGIVTGALASKYQADRINRICDELGLEKVHPLWHMDPKKEWEMLFELGFNVIIVGVAAYGLDESWLGAKMDPERLSELEKIAAKYGMHLGFEGGEAESFVLDGPNYKQKLVIDKAHNVWEGQSGKYIIDKAHLEPKN